MANYLSLEEAAQKLGIATDRLVELRSQGQVRGFRDGASWKFPEDAIEQLADDIEAGVIESEVMEADDDLGLAEDTDAGGSGDLVSDQPVASSASGSNIIGGDTPNPEDGEGSGSDLELGDEALQAGGSDVNLIAAEGQGSDVAIVASDSGSGLLEMESELDLMESGELGLADSGIASKSDAGSGSMVDISDDADELRLNTESDLSFSGDGPDDDSGEELIGADEDSALEALGSDIQLDSAPASSLELMGELDEPAEGSAVRGADVLSELDLLSAEQQGSGLISGDSENLLGSSGLGSSIGADGFKDSDLGGLDDALADDDELVIADDDDDLVLSSAGSDISVAGDSGINLMSPSDSGLSLESEPLDLAGSSISALDLGAELSEGGSSGSGGGEGSDGSLVDFQADEEFNLSPSGVGLDADIESGSQVIEVEDSEAIGEPVEFSDAFDEPAAEGVEFAEEPAAADALAVDDDEGESIAIDESSTAASVAPTAMAAYEVPFTVMQCVTLMLILCILSLGGMLMTDLVRNMWTYTEPSAPVSSLTDSLIGIMGW